METIEDILREMRNLGRLDEKSTDKIPRSLQALGLRTYADRLEAALKRKADSIHRAMVLIAGIEMEDSENPPRLWTALEDAYDALSDAMGADGETTADVEEAKATGRHFVVKPSNNAAKMPKTVDLRFDICQNIALVLKIGRDYQNKDGYRGAHYDTVKLLCDAIEYQQEQLKTKTEVGDHAKLREVVKKVLDAVKHLSRTHNDDLPEDVRVVLGDIAFDANAALSKPTRKCDVFSKDEVLKELDTRSFSKEDTIEWLYEEAKGMGV